MSKQSHISDHDLRLVIADKPTKTPHEFIETHVAQCNQCQQRLLGLAADESWRADFKSSLSAIANHAAFNETDTRSSSGERAVTGDDFDLQTINQMLESLLQSPTHPETLGSLGRYEIEKVIGFGGMGVVLRGFDRELHRPVAIKVISPRLSKNGTAKERFLREAKAAGAILHPNVIAIHDIQKANGVPWFVMPLVVGPTLQQVVEDHGPLPAKEIVQIAKQISAGLAAAHQQGLVHRDIKPANILVDNQINRIVITDFGLARQESEVSMTQTGMLTGTLNYMSPEQSRGEDVDARSDLFSLGSLLFFLATGVTPFQSSTPMGVIHKVGNESHSNAQAVNPDVPKRLAMMIDRLLEKSPKDRFQSAAKLEDWLSQYLVHLNQPIHAKPPGLPEKKPSPKTYSKSAVLVTSTVALAASLAIVFWVGTWFGNQPAKPTLSLAEIERKHGIEEIEAFDARLNGLTAAIESFRNSETQGGQRFHGLNPELGPHPFDQNLNHFTERIQQFSRQLPGNAKNL